jgi:hypothetical protein
MRVIWVGIRLLSFLLYSAPIATVSYAAVIAPERLGEEIIARQTRVPEFVTIRQIAKAQGKRVWLFGGAATTYAHYVKDRILEEDSGKNETAPTDSFSNIYRETQDIDIVIDGDQKDVEAFAAALNAAYPYRQGDRSRWEVRSLTVQVKHEEPLLGNSDFANQHTDSFSTGLIEISESSKDRIRDLRDWDKTIPRFLLDVANGELHYYFSTAHEGTKRFKDGVNPPIVSVIRYLTKAFQFDAKILPKDKENLKSVVRRFDPKAKYPKTYVATWMKFHVYQLFAYAKNPYRAWMVLEELGLREKLLATNFEFNRLPFMTQPKAPCDQDLIGAK